MADITVNDQIEDAVTKFRQQPEVSLDRDAIIAISQAVSLKRIADALEKANVLQEELLMHHQVLGRGQS